MPPIRNPPPSYSIVIPFVSIVSEASTNIGKPFYSPILLFTDDEAKSNHERIGYFRSVKKK